MKIERSKIEGVLKIIPNLHDDKRGFFYELFNEKDYKENSISTKFVQDNISYSKINTLRGLHFQRKYPQSKLVACLKGEILDVIVDLRSYSPTFGDFESFRLCDREKNLLFVPEGLAHGFCVISSEALVLYKCSEFYHPEDDFGLRWDDEDLNIPWPVDSPIISEKDIKLPSFKEIVEGKLTF